MGGIEKCFTFLRGLPGTWTVGMVVSAKSLHPIPFVWVHTLTQALTLLKTGLLNGKKKIKDVHAHKTKEKYAGGFLWDRNISSHYPDQGLCLPYHLYYSRPEILEKFIFIPDDPRNFKYGTRLITDDDALDLIERFMEICSILKAEGDQSEDWSARIAWLQSLVAELWSSRGLYPGLAKVMDYLAFNEAIPYFKSEVMAGREKEASAILFKFLDGRIKSIPDLQLTKERQRKIIRHWQLKNDDEKVLLKNVLPRFDLNPDQIQRILSEAHVENGIEASLSEIADNPYILSEQFTGDGPDDVITFNKIDHGIFPFPELGGESLADIDDWRRLRALCVERLKREDKHSFLKASRVIHEQILRRVQEGGDIDRDLRVIYWNDYNDLDQRSSSPTCFLSGEYHLSMRYRYLHRTAPSTYRISLLPGMGKTGTGSIWALWSKKSTATTGRPSGSGIIIISPGGWLQPKNRVI